MSLDESLLSDMAGAVNDMTVAAVNLTDLSETLESNIIDTIRNTQLGNWEIVGYQMIMRKEDGTELARFNLFDPAGKPTNKNISKRVKV